MCCQSDCNSIKTDCPIQKKKFYKHRGTVYMTAIQIQKLILKNLENKNSETFWISWILCQHEGTVTENIVRIKYK